MMYDENFFPHYKDVKVFRKGAIYNLVPLQVGSKKYNDIWRQMNMRDIKVKSIERVENSYLKKSFKLKKEKKLKENDHVPVHELILFHGTDEKNDHVPVHELILFHGTDEKSAKNIIKENFNWRKWGSRSHHWYHGKGVYFSHDATVSRRYPKRTFGLRYMIRSEVLFTTGMIGNESINIPPLNIDTTFSRDFHEMVKYEDNEFCPTHLITFIIKNNEGPKSHITIDGDTSRIALVPQVHDIPGYALNNKTKQLDEENREQNIVKTLTVYGSASNANFETLSFERYSTTSKWNWYDEEDLYSDSCDTSSSDESSESEEDTDECNENLHASKFYNWFLLNPLNFLKSIFVKPESENDDSDNSED